MKHNSVCREKQLIKAYKKEHMTIEKGLDLENTNIQLVISSKELASVIYQCVCKAMAEHAAAAPTASEQDTAGKMFTADEVCALLHVTKPTLWRWAKADYLKPVKVGTKNFYKSEDVEQLTK